MDSESIDEPVSLKAGIEWLKEATIESPFPETDVVIRKTADQEPFLATMTEELNWQAVFCFCGRLWAVWLKADSIISWSNSITPTWIDNMGCWYPEWFRQSYPVEHGPLSTWIKEHR